MKFLAQKEIQWELDAVNKNSDVIELRVGGSKHAFLYIFLAALFETEKAYPVVLENVPNITDVYYVCEYAKKAGAEIERCMLRKKIWIYRGVYKNIICTEYVLNCRTALLALTLHALKFGKAKIVNRLGGCAIGERNIDQHIRLWDALGFEVVINDRYLMLNKGIKENREEFLFEIDTTMGSVAAIYGMRHGYLTSVKNTSTRPEINALIEFVILCGCNMHRKGREIIVLSKSIMKTRESIYYRIMDDIDEAIAWSCLCHGLGIKAKIYAELPRLAVLDWLEDKSNGEISMRKGFVNVKKRNNLHYHRNIIIESSFHPNIGSDQQPILAVWSGFINERVYVSDFKFTQRYGYLDELKKIGWRIQTEEKYNILHCSQMDTTNKECKLELCARDLRGGFAVMMALIFNGENGSISNFEQLVRGYSDIAEKLTTIGIRYHYSNTQTEGSVAAIIKSLDGRYYVQKRGNDAPKNCGKLTFFGGRIEAEETPQIAIKRELYEELELEEEVSLIDEVQLNRYLFSTSGIVYLFQLDVPVDIKVCHEGELVLYTVDEILENNPSLFVRCVLETLQ